MLTGIVPGTCRPGHTQRLTADVTQEVPQPMMGVPDAHPSFIYVEIYCIRPKDLHEELSDKKFFRSELPGITSVPKNLEREWVIRVAMS